MICCSYCETENQENDKNCSFCGAELKRLRPKVREFVYLELCERPFQELELFHTYDLLVLLRLVRAERTKSYDLMRTVQKAPEDVEIDKELLGYSESQYRLYTARMKLIEGILIDRMEYKPKRVDDKLLESLRM
ncbi:hypothetical protein [Metabacillus fastidiosus]|uniref:hypothetical protein n=1 Tax=Metabacillus fastidiosus TaxID=1458 RepID=UPI000AC437EB|nr:hypothetical protein [Metabacillus fastidiosus]MED4462064.1 hypothetical protein [Metabacillus fastidiosus]